MGKKRVPCVAGWEVVRELGSGRYGTAYELRRCRGVNGGPSGRGKGGGSGGGDDTISITGVPPGVDVLCLKWFSSATKSGNKVSLEAEMQAAAAKFGLAPHVFDSIDGGKTGKGIAMELMDHPLSAEIKAKGSFTPARQADLVALCEQLGTRAKVVHGDCNSDNIMVDARGRLRFIDFGLAEPLKKDEKYGTNPNVFYLQYYLRDRSTGLCKRAKISREFSDAPIIAATLKRYCKSHKLTHLDVYSDLAACQNLKRDEKKAIAAAAAKKSSAKSPRTRSAVSATQAVAAAVPTAKKQRTENTTELSGVGSGAALFVAAASAVLCGALAMSGAGGRQGVVDGLGMQWLMTGEEV